MESEEQIYINLEELDDCTTKHQGPEKSETKPVRRAAVAREETNTCSPFRSTTVCLGLLCFLLLTTVVTVGVLHVRDVDQLSRELANHTAERHQLLVRHHNLTDERNRLQTRFDSAEVELHQMKKKMGSSTWEESKQACLAEEAHLVFIDSREEMEFLNKLETHHVFWIGLSKASDQTNWIWTDGRPLKTSYWLQYQYSSYYVITQSCAAFRRFSLYYIYQIKSWIKTDCAQSLQWVCERQTEKSW